MLSGNMLQYPGPPHSDPSACLINWSFKLFLHMEVIVAVKQTAPTRVIKMPTLSVTYKNLAVKVKKILDN